MRAAMRTAMRATLLRALFALLVTLFVPARTWAADLLASGTATFTTQGPVRLDAAGTATIALRNAGPGPLQVTSIYPRTTEHDPRIPGTLAASFEGGGTKAVIAPGETRSILVRWDRQGARMAQLFGHVVVESSDPHAPQIAIGVVSTGGPLGAHVLSLLVGAPLLGILGIALLGLARGLDEKIARYVALVAAAVPCAIAVWIARGFDPLASRLDGNEGLQLVERAVLSRSLGFEWSLGVDGLSLPILLVATATFPIAVLASFRVERGLKAYFAALLLAFACLAGALVAVDALLFVTFLGLSFLPLAVLVGRFGGTGRGRAAVRLLVAGAIATALLAVVVLALHRHADVTYLVDGTRARSFSIPELARVDWLARTHEGLALAGLPFVKGAWVLLFLGFGVLLPIVPLHRWYGDVVAEAPSGVAAIVVAVLAKLGIYGLLRLGVTIVPEGARWAAPSTAWLGAAIAIWAALAAIGERDLRRQVAQVSVVFVGLALVAIASLTAQGLTGAMAIASLSSPGLALLLLSATALEQRSHERSSDRFGGLAGDVPRLAIVAFVGAAAACAMPGTAGFVGAFLASFGAFPTQRLPVVVAMIAPVLAAVAVIGAHRRVYLGRYERSWRSSAYLEPFGGRFPDLDRRETVKLFALAIAVVWLGLAPSGIVGLTQGTIGALHVQVDPDVVR